MGVRMTRMPSERRPHPADSRTQLAVPEEKLLDQQGDERLVLNSNVLIEIGAVMALYGERFILLVEEGTTLPSNLQGLYEVRYSGPELGYEATVKVLKGLTAFKASPAS